jgi:hypothetical protein
MTFMQFSVSHTPDVMGNEIVLSVLREGTELISRVVTNLDGFTLGDDALDPASVSYGRTFANAGHFPKNHKLIITATTTNGDQQSHTEQWNDS